jgi:sulfoxide reductase heme-binding subunit YedZ
MKRYIKVVLFVLLLLPAVYYFYAVYLAFTGGENLLGPDPAKALSLATGEWAIRILILSLAMTPIRFLLNWPYAWQLRRMTGLYALFYVSLHFLVFLMFLLEWQWKELGKEILERPYITIGFSAFVLMIPLGLTSFNYAQRKLGRRWKQLHRVVYVINILAVLHVIWIVRSNFGDALLYSSLVLFMLGYRVLRHYSSGVKKFTFRKSPRPVQSQKAG